MQSLMNASPPARKQLAFTHQDSTRFAIGDFSPVLSVFSYRELGQTVSPFLLLDHLGPGRLLPGDGRRGVSEHPHRGFETVTLVFAGELAHQDSSGGGGVIQAGDVQWMTAGGGIVHREYFSETFARAGGRFEMIQLWVNLPARDKLVPARYQSLRAADIPVVTLPDNAGSIRVIAGDYAGWTGPAQTHTRIRLLDVTLAAGATVILPAGANETAAIYLRDGSLALEPDAVLAETALAVLSHAGQDLQIRALERSRCLLLGGEPIHEPIFGQGPFVMNRFEEVLQAFEDFQKGGFRGTTAADAPSADG